MPSNAYIKRHQTWPAYANDGKYSANPADYNGGEWYTRPYIGVPCGAAGLTCGADPCGGTGEPLCGPWKLSDRPAVPNWNNFTLTGQTEKSPCCFQFGYKMALSRLSWYGRPSFSAPCLDQNSDRYRTATTDATAYWVNAFVYDAGGYASADPAHEGSLTIHRKYTVNKSSGVIESTGNTDTSTGEAFAGACDSGPDALTGIANLLELVCNGELIPQDCDTIYTNPMDDPLTNCDGLGTNCLLECTTNEITNGGKTYTLEYTFWQLYQTTTANPAYDPSPGGDCRQYLWDYVEQGSVSFTVTLSDAYTKEDFLSDAAALLDLIPLNDDAKFPWQTGATPIIAPFVTRKQVVGRTAPPFYNALSWSDPVADCYHGTLLGVLEKPGVDKVFAPDYPVAQCCGEWPAITIEVNGAGAYSTAYAVPKNSTYWTEISSDLELLPCAGGFQHFDGVTLTRAKWCEGVTIFPAQRWARGGLDRYAIDEDKARCIITVAGATITTETTLGTLTNAPCYVSADGITPSIYSVTGSATTYVLDSLTPLYAAPDSIDYRAGTGLLAPIRFPDAWPIKGKASATAAIAGGLISVETSNLWLRTGDGITLEGCGVHGAITVTGATTFTIAGASLDGFTGLIYATAAESYLSFFSEARKGTAVFVQSNGTATPTREQVTFDALNCHTILCISDTATDVWPNMVKKPLPSLQADGYGRACFHQIMGDVFQQTPHVACVTHLDDTIGATGCTMSPDDGSCKADTCTINESGAEVGITYFAPLIREAVLTLPAGAPALPSGVTLDVDQYSLPALVSIRCSGPLPLTNAPWQLFNNMRVSGCDSECRLSSDYRKGNQIRCA